MTRPLVFVGGRLIDGTGRPPVEDAAVLCESGLITWAGPRARLAAPPNADVIDVRSRTILPGFFDCHTHLTMRPGEGDALARLTAPQSLRVLQSVPNLRDTLLAGVTTVRDLSGADLGTKLAVERGLIRGPRVLIAIRILSITGGHGDWRSANGVDLTGGSGGGAVADGPDAFVRATRAVLQEGADCVKIAASGGMSSPRGEPAHGGLSAAEIEAVVTEAARHGDVAVAAHAQAGPGLRDAVRAGVRSIEHGYHLDDATIGEMVERGTFLVPTLSTLLREPEASDRRRWTGTARERLARAFAAGVPVALGTDAGLVPHGTNLRELELLVDFGLSPMAAIVAGTSAAARLCGVDGELGTVEPGKRADLVVADGDPLTRIGVLADPANIVLVLKDGQLEKDTAELFRAKEKTGSATV
ncbi:metal-dependent hydrolase family protein [Amycolatopsis acidicola]|uniref:metal-dependent hydrolase family protein n=1 Tax=Amycolatopsis acidicola TaxID=2596893 RepID=UPI001AA053E1|nr:amidohydrolase family protein [Amycolatopsis acidicola]